jgi:hypothetical protein
MTGEKKSAADLSSNKKTPNRLAFFSREVAVSFVWAIMIAFIFMAHGIYTRAVDFVYANF